jgi:tRNA pseudouridine38-40 synthase
MARYKVILAYDGTEFFGSQRQADARTVQSVFETALRKLDWADQSISLAGRTDSGVHASGQVAAFNLNWNHPPETLLRALNALLPKDVAAQSVSVCAEGFHPRFDAVERSYCYKIFCDPTRDPLRERYAWRIWPLPDFNLLQVSANALIGTYDFAPFGRPTSPGGSTIREVKRAGWQLQDDRLTFRVTANAFLYHMVRRMVFVQVSCGQGKLEPGVILQVLLAPQNQPIFQGLAPPQGLSLVEVSYPSEAVRITNLDE